MSNIAPNIRTTKTAFLNVAFADIEPVTDITAGRVDAILQFATFRQQTGEKLAFL